MIGTVVITNVDDLRFLDKSIPQLLMFTDFLSISIGSKKWDGTPEDMSQIMQFVMRHVDPKISMSIYDPIEECARCPHAHHVRNRDMLPEAYARYVALNRFPRDVDLDYVIFLDADEIIDGKRFSRWLETGEYKKYDVLKLACYWYWRQPIYRARGYLEDSIVMIKHRHVTPSLIFNDLARTWFYDAVPTINKARMIVGCDGLPLVHHYSWVRTFDQMISKVTTWGHKSDFPYIPLVKAEFSRKFNGTDFLKGLQYDIVDDVFGLLLDHPQNT